MATTYKIVRFYSDDRIRKIIKSGLTLEEAQQHCKRPDTHERDDQGKTIWFDGYEKAGGK